MAVVDEAAVVVVVGAAEDVGRMATAGGLVDCVVDVGDGWVGELVTVEVVEVVAVEVRADVRGIGAMALGVVEELDVEDVEELLGDSVTVGSIVETTVVPTMQPTLSQTLPGMQQPPPKLSGHAVSPAGQPETVLPQTCPLSQQPTSPNPASGVIWQTRPVAQQLFGRFIEVHEEVPPGHAKSRVSRAKMASGDRSRRLKRDRISRCSLVCRE